MEIEVLCPGCSGCERLAEIIREEARILGVEASVKNVSEMSKIRRHTPETPGILVNGDLKHSGKPQPTREKIRVMLEEVLGQ